MKVPGTFIYDYDICMGKVPRVDVADLVYHAYNRGNADSQIFFNNKDYFAFENVIEEAKDKASGTATITVHFTGFK